MVELGRWLRLVADALCVRKHLLPNVDAQYDLGASNAAWNNAYIDGGISGDAVASDTYNASVAKVLKTAADGGLRVDHLELGNVTGATEGELRAASNVRSSGFVFLGPMSTLTIASGVITVTGSYHVVDTEDGAATDNLDTINGGGNGALLVLRTANTSRDVVLKDGAGNLALAGDCTLSTTEDRIMLIQHSGWWCEISRSDNS